MRRSSTILSACLLAACSQSAPDSGTSEEQAAPPAAPAKGAAGTAPLNVALPRIAYIYRLDFSVAGGSIAEVQRAHVALCDRLGPARCQLVSLNRGGGDAQYASGAMKLRVASDIARPFSQRLEQSVSGAGGRTVGNAIEAEDVSKQMVDAEARIRQRSLLVERLTDILRRRDGKVGELVEAERGVAAAQEELDQARAWLNELQGRVAMSTFELSYNAAAPASNGLLGSLRETVDRSGSLFTLSLRALLNLLILVAPWALVGGVGWWGWRRWHRNRPTTQPPEV